jgi:low temperature requirement protein LtrA
MTHLHDDHTEETLRTVTPLELFFDLVYVFAFTQVTAMLSSEPTGIVLAQGVLILAALWWSWGAYAWLASAINPEDGYPRLIMFAAMGGMLVAALAVPTSFQHDATLFAVAYFIVRALHIVMYLAIARHDPHLWRAVMLMAPSALLAPAMLIGASFLDDVHHQMAVWLVALLADYLGVLLSRGEGWRLSAHHFAERHGLIFIVALGESIVAIGIGAGTPHPDVIIPALLGLVITATLWWTYFDVVALVAANALASNTGRAQATQARDSYSYLHMPMIVGVILFALGVKKALGHIDEPLKLIPAVALCGGIALYHAAHILFRLRNIGTLNKHRSVTVVLLLVLLGFGRDLTALEMLSCVTAISVLLVLYELIRFSEARQRVREKYAQH